MTIELERIAAFVHPTAIVEDGVRLGRRTRVWDSSHVRRGAVIGEDCIVGGKSHIAGEVRIGDRCKINAMVYICCGVTLGDGVMVAAHTTFTNDFYPRACVNDLSELRPSEVDAHTTFTTVQAGVTIGAGATIGSNLVIGRFAVVGMGAVVTSSVAPYTLVVGMPARPMALVCRCGPPIVSLRDGTPADGSYPCAECDLTYEVARGTVIHDPLDSPGELPEPVLLGAPRRSSEPSAPEQPGQAGLGRSSGAGRAGRAGRP